MKDLNLSPQLERIRRRFRRLYGTRGDQCLERLEMIMGIRK